MSGVLTHRIGIAGAPGIFATTLSSGTNPTSCEFQIQNDGEHLFGDGASGATTEDWITPSDTNTAAYYQVKSDVTAGSFNTDPSAGVYLDCSTTRTWIKTAAGTVTFTLTFREKGSGLIRKTYAGMTMTVT